MILTLCGSTRFKDAYEQLNKALTLRGDVVFSVGYFARSTKEPFESIATKEQIAVLDKVHRKKIDLSDGIVIVNVNGYTGERTDSEIEYALAHEKKIFWSYRAIPPNWYWLVTANKCEWLPATIIDAESSEKP